MSKEIKFEKDAKNAIIKGVDAVADLVKITLGPCGRNVLIRNQISTPIITNDGVTIAKSIQLKDNSEDAGAALMISVANKTNDKAGDGTTTTTLLTQTMIHKYYEMADETTNAVQVQKEMIKASNDISKSLLDMAVPATDLDSIKRVASISSGSEELGELIANAFEGAGEYGSVIVEDSKTDKDELISIQGMKLSNGSVNQYLLADVINAKSDVYDGNVLIMKDKIDTVAELFPILEMCAKEGRKLLIICDDIEYDPLNAILVNKGRINLNVVRLPGFGELREKLVEDLCIATGAKLISRELGVTLRDFDTSFLGEVSQFTVTRDDTIIKFKEVNSAGINLLERREERVKEIQATIDALPSSENIEQYKRRISNLISGISVIKVGGNSEVEIKDRKLRIEDAINSVQSAKEEGIVPGGGFSFLSVIMKVAKENRQGNLGEQVVYGALEAVTRQIAKNAGYDEDLVIANCYNKELGFNALTGEYENLLETGVINSVKVDRYSVLNATSTAATIITMGGSVVEENEPDHNVLQLQTNSPLPIM